MSILSAVTDWVQGSKASKAIQVGNEDAQHGVQQAQDKANVNLPAAGDTAINAVNTATGTANDTLAKGYNDQRQNLQTYLDAGTQGTKGLQDYAASNPQFSFNYDDYKNSDAYKFQLEQGQETIGNQAAAHGLASSGNVLKDLTTFGQGLASTYYDKAFDRAKQMFQTNSDTTFKNLSELAKIGQTGTQQFNQATQNTTNSIAENDIGAGKYEGDTRVGLSKFLADLDANSAVNAGKFRVARSGAEAAGDINAGHQIGELGSSLADLFTGVMQLSGGGK